MTDKIYDVIIVGAGPAGCTCALHLSGHGLKIALIEKRKEAGGKICGDALSGTVMNSLKKLPGNAFERFLAISEKLPSFGIRFFAPSGEFLDLPFSNDEKCEPAPGYTFNRNSFDKFLREQIQLCTDIDFISGFDVSDIKYLNEFIYVTDENIIIKGRVIAGADGVFSKTASILANKKKETGNICLGARTYFTGIKDLHPDNFIELHFLKDLLPGYLWIFPMSGGIANVGLGMMEAEVRKKRVSLSKMLDEIINTDPRFRARFSDARRTEPAGAHPLHMGPSNTRLSGDRFLLLGDAASLVDPFTGEGIGNAMISGEIAAETIKKADGNYSAENLHYYDKNLKQKIYPDLILNKKLQKLVNYPFLFDMIVRKVNRNEKLRKLFIRMYTENEARKELKNPLFYLKLLFI